MLLSHKLKQPDERTSARFSGRKGVRRCWIFAFGIASGAVWMFSWMDPVAETLMRNAVNVITGVDGTILGFLVAAGALLYAVADTRLSRNLWRTGHFPQLLSDLFFDAGIFLVALIWGLACLFVPNVHVGSIPVSTLEIGVLGMVFFNVVAFVLLIPVGHKMWLLLSNATPDNPDRLE